jgi:endonuclease YncB( thermonuclease family)
VTPIVWLIETEASPCAVGKPKELAEAEVEARREKKGLWVDKSAEPPWEFRKMEREKHGKK